MKLFTFGSLFPTANPTEAEGWRCCTGNMVHTGIGTGGWLFYHVGNLGNPGIWKNIISGISWCIWNLLVLLCIHPWNWFIKAIKDLVGLNLQKPSEFTPQNCKWICCHYYELLWHKHLKPLLQLFILHCFSLPAPCFENSFQPNSKEG